MPNQTQRYLHLCIFPFIQGYVSGTDPDAPDGAFIQYHVEAMESAANAMLDGDLPKPPNNFRFDFHDHMTAYFKWAQEEENKNAKK